MSIFPVFPWSEYVYLIIGFLLLIKGADTMVSGASSIAKSLGISPLVIGLTVVAFGTSAPELFVNVLSAMRGQTDLAFGNIIGSNIANIWLILGIAAVIYPLQAQYSTIYREVPYSFLASLVLIFIAFDVMISGLGQNVIVRGDGLVLLAFFVIFFVYTFTLAKEEPTEAKDADITQQGGDIPERSTWSSVGMIILGLIGLSVGAQLLVGAAQTIAQSFWVSESVIGLTVIAFGTSLPELATSIIASLKRESDIVIGNVVGSNIFNLLGVLWVTSVVSNISVSSTVIVDVMVELFAIFTLMITLFFIGKLGRINRSEGVMFLLCYVMYMVYIFVTQIY